MVASIGSKFWNNKFCKAHDLTHQKSKAKFKACAEIGAGLHGTEFCLANQSFPGGRDIRLSRRCEGWLRSYIGHCHLSAESTESNDDCQNVEYRSACVNIIRACLELYFCLNEYFDFCHTQIVGVCIIRAYCSCDPMFFGIRIRYCNPIVFKCRRRRYDYSGICHGTLCLFLRGLVAFCICAKDLNEAT